MADEEIVGGIAVGISGDDTRLEADLRAALVLIEQWRQQAAKAATVALRVESPTQSNAAASRTAQAEEQAYQRSRTNRQTQRRAAARQELTDEEQTANQRIQIVDRIEKQRRQARESRGQSPIEVNRSEQALYVQRIREETTATKAAVSTRDEIERAAAQSRLAFLSQQQQKEQAFTSPSTTIVGRQRSPAEIRRIQEESAARVAALAASGAQPVAGGRSSAPPSPPSAPYELPGDRAAVQRLQRERLARALQVERSAANAEVQREVIRRRAEQGLAAEEARIVGAGRTSRTQASTLGGFFGGGRRELGEAINAQKQAEQELNLATRHRQILTRQIVDLETRSVVLKDKAAGIEARRIRESPELRRAQEEEQVAAAAERRATERVEKISGSARVAAQNLLAVTAAGAAFGLGLKAVDIALAAAGRAAEPYFDALTGYAQKTATLTGALADQTRVARGDSQAVVGLHLAQTGLAQSAVSSIQPLIQQRASLEAGNKAIQEQIDTFRIAENLRRAAPTAGIGQATGGVLGTPLFGVPSTGEQIGNFLQQSAGRGQISPIRGALATNPITGLAANIAFQGENLGGRETFARGLEQVNRQIDLGGESALQLQRALTGSDARIEATAKAFDNLSPEMARAIRDLGLYNEQIANQADAAKAAGLAQRSLLSINRAGQFGDIGAFREAAIAQQRFEQERQFPIQAELARRQLQFQQSQPFINFQLQQLQSQQQFNRPSVIAAAERQAVFAREVQLPAQAALQNLAAPPPPPGTGIVAANADEQERINQNLERTNELQDQLNARYRAGRDILEQTYNIPAPLLDQISAIGQEMANIQAGIANRQAQYQVAQYNFQLQIARRTLSDIVGLTGRQFGGETVAASRLGILERENLALSRQGQLLQFNLAQRQVNFQRAVAGFTAPGLTPEERAARIEQANIEADFAQRQLDLSKNIFQNQVQIVDIENLRQGEDLARQIGLLIEGRELTIDTAAAQQELQRLAALQQQLVQEAGTYIQQADQLVAAAFGDIQQLEAAAGRAMNSVAVQVLEGFGIVLNGLSGELDRAFPPADPTAEDRERNRIDRQGGGARDGNTYRIGGQATGGVYRASSPTGAVFGEAGDEMGIFLRNPRPWTGDMVGGGGPQISITFTGQITVRDEEDLRKIESTVEGAIVRALGRGSSLQGLRIS